MVCQSFQHEANHGELGECYGHDGEGFVMRHEAAVAPEPGKGALDNPAPPHKLEAALIVRALDDLEGDPLRGHFSGESVSPVAAIRKDVFDEGEQAARLFDQRRGAIPVLDICWDRLDAKDEADGVNERVAFDSLDFFARIVANRIPAAPPFSVALTACVSIMAAVGEASRPPASRHSIKRT